MSNQICYSNCLHTFPKLKVFLSSLKQRVLSVITCCTDWTYLLSKWQVKFGWYNKISNGVQRAWVLSNAAVCSILFTLPTRRLKKERKHLYVSERRQGMKHHFWDIGVFGLPSTNLNFFHSFIVQLLKIHKEAASKNLLPYKVVARLSFHVVIRTTRVR